MIRRSSSWLLLQAFFALLLGILAIPVVPAAAAESDEASVRISIRSSPTANYYRQVNWDDPSVAKALRTSKPRLTEEAPQLSDVYLEVEQNGRISTYRMELSGNLWSEEQGGTFDLPRSSAQRLLQDASRLSRVHYGELVSWNDARKLVPKFKVFTVVDLETGLSFKVQRRAGSDHADVQPVSKEDSRIMKTIYEDRWSWRRKAILVRVEGRQLAASMNGMPHGGDGIPGNDFKGHFCIHFLDSSTHKSEVPDLAHQLMVYKAAGQPRALLMRLTPLTHAESFAEAINQNDREWVRLFLEGTDREQTIRMLDRVPEVLSIHPTSPDRVHFAEDALTAEGELMVAYQRSGKGKSAKPLRFEFVRLSPAAPWRIQRLIGDL